jgi:hypothetical protein
VIRILPEESEATMAFGETAKMMRRVRQMELDLIGDPLQRRVRQMELDLGSPIQKEKSERESFLAPGAAIFAGQTARIERMIRLKFLVNQLFAREGERPNQIRLRAHNQQ